MLVDAMLCDHVQLGGDGKLYVTGAGATEFLTFSTSLPFTVRVGLAVTVTVTVAEARGVHPVQVWAQGRDGQRLPIHVAGSERTATVVSGALTVDRPPPGAADAMSVVVFSTLLDLDVPEGGTYAVGVSVEGVEPRLLPFQTGLVPAPDQVPPPSS